MTQKDHVRETIAYNPIHKGGGREIYKLDSNTGEILAKYSSIKQGADMNGACAEHIYRVCRGKRKNTAGFGWKYVKQEKI